MNRARRALAFGVAAAAFAASGARGADAFDIAAATPPRVLDPSYFGTHFHRLDRGERDFPATAWPQGMIGALRLWDSHTRWADIEPARGRFQFDRLDRLVALAAAQGVPVLLVLGSPARWASARPQEYGPYGAGSAAEPRDPEDWERYVTAISQRYRGRIAQYELWNEPYFHDLPEDRDKPSAFFTGSVAAMVELARRTRGVLAREDPSAMLLSPGFVGAPNRLELFLAAGGKRYVDGVAYHFYVENDRELIELTARVRAVMARHDIGRLPLYNTESGFALRGAEGEPLPAGATPIDRRTAATLLARSMLLGAFLGIERFYQYAWDNGRMGMLRADGRTATESWQAYASVRRWLRNTTLRGCSSRSSGIVRCEGERGGRRLVVAWRPDGGQDVQTTIDAGADAWPVEHAIDGPLPLVANAHGVRSVRVGAVPVAWWLPAGARTP